MKKILSVIAAAVLSAVCAFAVAGCKNSENKLKVFVPDGAPALSVAGINQTEADKYFTVSAVAAATINTYVTGDNPQADVAVLPVNAAVKLLGDGKNYKMLGTVTHGNLFLMKKPTETDIATPADLSKLTGKTVGVINLVNVPGLTFKALLKDNGIEFNELKDGAAVDPDKVNLKNVTAQEAAPVNADCQYFIVPEPAASTKAAVTQGKLSFAGNIQTLYGGEGGYPQAVAVAKASVISSSKKQITALLDSFTFTEGWLKAEDTSPEQIVSAVGAMLSGDIGPMFTAANLTRTVISNCGIRFVSAAESKTEILAYMQKLNGVSANAWGTPADAFFG